MKTVIEFGGFYGSVHEGLVESAVEGFFGEDYADDEGFEPTWGIYFENYIKEYAKNLSEWLVDDYGIEVEFNNLSLYSPREYNFKTDTIHADLSELDAEQLKAAFKDNKEFLSYLQDATQSVSGYISFYTFADALADKDGILMQYLLRWLCDLFNESELMSYFDRNCSYDNLIN